MKLTILLLLAILLIAPVATASAEEAPASSQEVERYTAQLWDRFAELGREIQGLQGKLEPEIIATLNTRLYRARETLWYLEQEMSATVEELARLEQIQQELISEIHRLREQN